MKWLSLRFDLTWLGLQSNWNWVLLHRNNNTPKKVKNKDVEHSFFWQLLLPFAWPLAWLPSLLAWESEKSRQAQFLKKVRNLRNIYGLFYNFFLQKWPSTTQNQTLITSQLLMKVKGLIAFFVLRLPLDHSCIVNKLLIVFIPS